MELILWFVLVAEINAPSSVLAAGSGAGSGRAGGGGIFIFFPGFSVRFISGADREKDGVVSGSFTDVQGGEGLQTDCSRFLVFDSWVSSPRGRGFWMTVMN